MINRKLLVPKILGKNNYDEYKENLLETFLNKTSLLIKVKGSHFTLVFTNLF